MFPFFIRLNNANYTECAYIVITMNWLNMLAGWFSLKTLLKYSFKLHNKRQDIFICGTANLRVYSIHIVLALDLSYDSQIVIKKP